MAAAMTSVLVTGMGLVPPAHAESGNPGIVIVKPGDGSWVAQSYPEIAGIGGRPGEVVTIIDGKADEAGASSGIVVCVTEAQSDGGWSCVPDKPLAEGEHTLVAMGEDGAHRSDPSKPVRVVIDTQRPSRPVIVKPVNGSSVCGPKPEISGSDGEPGTLLTVIDAGTNPDGSGTDVCATVVRKDGTWSCVSDEPLAEGEHALVAIGKDKAGNTSDPSRPAVVVVGPECPKTSAIDPGSVPTASQAPVRPVVRTGGSAIPLPVGGGSVAGFFLAGIGAWATARWGSPTSVRGTGRNPRPGTRRR